MGLHYMADAAFDDLLACWRSHENVRRRSDITLRRRAASRRRLDDARSRMHRLRLALHPEPAERVEAVATVLCATLDRVVYLGLAHRDENRPGMLRCACGELIPLHE